MMRFSVNTAAAEKLKVLQEWQNLRAHRHFVPALYSSQPFRMAAVLLFFKGEHYKIPM